ncbi:integrase [Mesorhizobium waimense]|uniref:Integrase n=1 Tax=Mesorhizobium waimense TaxID=1300307 RepID=A0A3A5JQW5_9HYPH|nr:site-specific integrase [Mesorhizobium waimense]RJT23238.1 integrase [Mesorhizobium waimense]
MLELYFKYPSVLRRLRSGALGGEMDRIAAHFSQVGYKHTSAKVYISRLARFSDFAARSARRATIEQDIVDRFVHSLRTATPRIAARTAIEHARRVAPERFSTPRRHTAPAHDGPLLAAYLDHLRHVRGLEPKTCEGLLTSARRILTWLNDHLPDQGLAALTGEHVLGLVQHLLSLSANDYTRSSTTSYARTFLRFLRWAGLNDRDLARFVPRTPCWRLAHLPPRLPWEDIQRTIDAIDVTMPSGVRDRALLLVLATTGLRNKEIRMLELQDIRWRTAEVLVRRTKGKRDRVVPLLHEAGAALADYVLHARPKIESQRVFLSYVPPVRPFKYPASISRIVRSRLERSGIELSGAAGAHLLRHSLATQLVRQRRPINEVGDLLGHRSIDTTAIYVKVALPQLSDVALPFPGGAL